MSGNVPMARRNEVIMSSVAIIMKSLGGGNVINNFIQINFGLYMSLFGCGLIVYGLLKKIKNRANRYETA